MAYDPIEDRLSTIQDKIDKYKLIPRYAVFVTSAVFLYAMLQDIDIEKMKFTGYLFVGTVLIYTLGVDFIKEMADYMIRNKVISNETLDKMGVVADKAVPILEKVDDTIDKIKEKVK